MYNIYNPFIRFYDSLLTIIFIIYDEIDLVMNLSLVPLLIFKYAVYIYENPLNQRKQMLIDLKGKSGIYCWYNKLTVKFYIGSAVNFINSINRYF